MTPIRQACLTGILWLLVLGNAHLLAESHGLNIDVQSVTTTARSGAPLPLIVRLHWQGQGLLEGRLEFTLRDAREVVTILHSHDMALTKGEQSFHFLLPPLNLADSYVQLELDTAFRTPEKHMPLDSFLLRAPSVWQRSFVVCVSEPRLAQGSKRRQALANALRFEQFHTEDSAALITTPALLEPNDMPTDPLRYCAYDVVLLHGDGFAQLSRKSLTALRQWVQAGGSVCIVAPNNASAEHIGFLNDLVEGEPFFVDASGNMAVNGVDETPEPFLVHDGLGRAAIFVESAVPQDFETPAWREAVAFLWKIRADQLPAVHNSGRWDSGLLRKKYKELLMQSRQVIYNDEQLDHLTFNVRPIETGGLLVRHLIPGDLQMVPLGLIGGILGLYILVIGPGDYLLLGRFRIRKLTWILFPAVTIAFMLLGIELSHAYLGTADHRRALEFLDVGDDDRIVRRNRFELVFFSLARTAETSGDGCLFSPIDHQILGSLYDPYQYSYQNTKEPALVGPAVYSGRFPSHYAALQDVPQWTPQLNRLLSVGPAESPVKFDWESIDGSELKSIAGRARVAARLTEAFGSEAAVSFFHRGQLEFQVGSHPLANRSNELSAHGQVIESTFLKDCCIRRESGLFFLISQISPRGGDNFEDLTLMDSSDAHQWLIAVVVDRGDDTFIYRKLYRLPDDT